MSSLAGSAYLAALIGGAVLSVAASVPYIRNTVRGIRNPRATRGIAKPQVVSWAIWSGILFIGGASSVEARQWPAAAYTLTCGVGCGLIAVLALRIPVRYRDPPVMVPLWREKTVRLDFICLAGGLAGLMLLALARDRSAAVMVAIATDLIAYIPTLVHAWQEPYEETWLSYAMYSAGGALTLAAVAISRPGSLLTVTAVAYPAYVLATDGGFAAMLCLRRREMRVPAAATVTGPHLGTGGAATGKVVATTPALYGRPGGAGIAIDPAAGRWPPLLASAWPRRASVWQRLQLPWAGAGIVWAPSVAQTQPPPVLAPVGHPNGSSAMAPGGGQSPGTR